MHCLFIKLVNTVLCVPRVNEQSLGKFSIKSTTKRDENKCHIPYKFITFVVIILCIIRLFILFNKIIGTVREKSVKYG